jgi:hypothetical protein
MTSKSVLFSVCVCVASVCATPIAGAQEVQQQTIRITSGDSGPINILPPGREPKTGTSAIRGRIVAGDTGSGLRRAQVRISGPDIGTKTVLTDNQGRYELKDLPAGRFNVSVTKSGYVSMQYGQNRPYEPGRPIELVDSQVLDRADISMPRGGVLAGRVVDETGEAVIEADVTAMRMQFQNGKRRLVATGRNATTNDLGQFRLYGLPPGEYYVSATLRNAGALIDMIAAPGVIGSNQTAGYASTYYPSTPNPAEAQRVTLSVGQELPAVDIQLQPVKLTKITGVALGSDGKPISGASVMLLPSMKDVMLALPLGSARTDKNGNFTINGVSPGDYTLSVQSGGAFFATGGAGNVMMFSLKSDDPASPAAPPQREFGSTSLSANGEDITGLVITTTRGAKAAGTISFSGSQPDGATNVRINAPATDADNNPMPATVGTVNADLTFQVESLVGNHIFRPMNLPKGWVLKSVVYNGQDVTDAGVDFRPGEDVSGIAIQLTSTTQTVTGTVSSEGNGDLLKDYTVVVFPDDPQKWTLPQNRWMSSARPDQDGRYRVTSLPTGRYYAIAVDYVAQGDWQDPDWLARAAKKATAFTLEDGANKTLDLKLSGS